MTTMDGQRAAGGSRALALSTVAFTVCFAVWTIFAIIGVEIKAELGLTETQFGLLVATPVLTGSLTRLILGIWAEQFGGRVVFTAQMLLTAAGDLGADPRRQLPYLPACRARRRTGGRLVRRSAWLTSRTGFPRRSRAQRSGSSARATSARR